MFDERSIPHQALAALEQLNNAGFSAYLVGGCVRDLLMGREPGDFDVTTAATPEQVEAVFAGERVIETGLKHGTVTVLLEGLPLEITTYRRDVSYSDHRHPDAVCFTPRLEDDLARRDFTVNAMAWHPEKGLVDCFGGRADLENRLIRCVGDPARRFDEDALRILRTLRFAATLDFAIHPDTAAAALEQRDLLDHVSRERIAAELTKLLCGPAVERVVTAYWQILAVPLPELGAMAGFDQRSKYHCYDVLTHCAVACAAAPPDRLTRWAALLHDVGKPACYTLDEGGRGHFYGHAKVSAAMTEEILTRLRFDKDTVRRVTQLVALHDYPIDPPVEPPRSVGYDHAREAGPSYRRRKADIEYCPGGQSDRLSCCAGISDPYGTPPAKGSPEERAVKRLLGRLGEEDFFRLLDVKRGDAAAHAPEYRGRMEVCGRLEALGRELLARQACFSLKDLAVNGSDLLELGLPPGPFLGSLLDRLLEAVLNGETENDRQALLDLAKRTLQTKNP